eukprot:12408504-Karenia_brevis.AAC.1
MHKPGKKGTLGKKGKPSMRSVLQEPELDDDDLFGMEQDMQASAAEHRAISPLQVAQASAANGAAGSSGPTAAEQVICSEAQSPAADRSWQVMDPATKTLVDVSKLEPGCSADLHIPAHRKGQTKSP